MVAPDASVIGTRRSIVEAIYCEIHHTVVRILVGIDRFVHFGYGACLRFDASLVDEEIII